MAKETNISTAQELYNFLYKACDIIRGPVSHENFKDYITPLLYFKRQTHKGNRLGCACMESRGLGDYNSCPNGCRYCYANKDHAKALENYRLHDPNSPLLLGHVQETDTIKPSVQTSMLIKNEPTLF